MTRKRITLPQNPKKRRVGDNAASSFIIPASPPVESHNLHDSDATDLAKLTSSAFRSKSLRAMPRIAFKSTSNLAAPSTPEGLKSRNLQRGVSPTPAPSMRSHHCCPGTPQSQDEAPDTFESLRDASALSPLGHGAATHKAVARIRAPTTEAMDAQRSDKDNPCMKVFSVALCLAFLRFCCHCREWCRSLCHM